MRRRSAVRKVAAGRSGRGSANPVVQRPRRVYPDLVTAEAEPGEELVYGDAATAVIAKWREARDAVGKPRDALDRLNARQRWYELEIELIEQHELTLPPATRSWDWGDRRQEVRRRNEALDEIMVDRKMLKLRRFLTFGTVAEVGRRGQHRNGHSNSAGRRQTIGAGGRKRAGFGVPRTGSGVNN